MSVLNPLAMCRACVPWVYPLVYDDCCLTIPQQIAKIQSKINEIVNAINESDDSVKAYVDQQVSSAIQECKKYTDDSLSAQYTKLLTIINSVQNYAKNLDSLQRNYIDKQLNEVWFAIRNLNSMGGTIVINPTTGKQDSLQNTLDDMYTVFRYFALTANRYDELHMTANEYDSYHVSAYEYDYWGILTFKNNWFTEQLTMFHPVTGNIVSYKDVIYWLTNFHKPNALTATAYDDLNIEASEYDVYDISAYEYDFNGATHLNV